MGFVRGVVHYSLYNYVGGLRDSDVEVSVL